MYNDKVIDYAKNPRNQGGMDDADAIGEVSNPDCGDGTTIYLKVRDNIIVDVKFDTFGCAAAVATSSKLTEMVKGKSLEEASEITETMVAKELGGLPLKKMHCSDIGIGALADAIREYREKQEK